MHGVSWTRMVAFRDVLAASVGAIVLALASHFVPLLFPTQKLPKPIFIYDTELYEELSVARLVVINAGLGAAREIRIWAERTPNLKLVSFAKDGVAPTQIKDCSVVTTPLNLASFNNETAFCVWIPALPAGASVTFVLSTSPNTPVR